MSDAKRPVVGYSFHAGDLFHPGHLHQLEQCVPHCDFLIVGLLTNEAIASYKREPIVPLKWRIKIYEALRMVDLVVVQPGRDPTPVLEILQPDVLFHGDDWIEIPGKEWMESRGKKCVATPYKYGWKCTTEIIQAILDREDLQQPKEK